MRMSTHPKSESGLDVTRRVISTWGDIAIVEDKLSKRREVWEKGPLRLPGARIIDGISYVRKGVMEYALSPKSGG